MNDEPIAYTKEGRPLYDNAPTVVCMLIPDSCYDLYVIRRAKNPGAGLLALPGGFHMKGESWQECGAREVWEETKIRVPANEIALRRLVTDEFGHNVVVAEAHHGGDTSMMEPEEGEVLEIVRINEDTLGSPEDWAFPIHYEAAKKWLIR